MKRRYLLVLIFIGYGVGAVCQAPRERRLSAYVNPFIGASTSIAKGENLAGLGKTFPGAATPFGLVQVSPNTITGGDNGSGYSYEHTSIEGFACTQMSGVGWYGDLGNFLVMPTTGVMKVVSGTLGHEADGYRSAYDKSSEKASAGYYAVKLTKYNIRAEVTAAPHSAFMRFTFPAGARSRIQIDLARRVGGTSTAQFVQVVDDHTIRGWMKCTPEGGGWGHGDGHADYTVYFYAQFSTSIRDHGVWSGDTVQRGVSLKEGHHLGFYAEFATSAGDPVLLKTGVSFVSMAGAEKNLKAEIKDWDFARVHEAAQTLWDQALGKIKITGGTENERTIFYTSLYHTLIDPRILSDVDGTYPGGDGQPHTTSLFTKHSIFSGWDVFRSQMPLQTIINPKMVNDLLASLVELADQSGKGYLERWELINAYSGCMVGNPAVVVLADAYAKGIRDYDINKAYKYAINTCEKFGNKDGWDPNISVTLEHAFDEWCLSRLSAALGKTDDEKKYAARGESYKNIFNDSVHWFRPRRKDGSWEPWPAEGRLKQDYWTVESNAYQQGWFVPQDIPGMVKLMGGRDAVIADLKQFFEKTPEDMLWNNYYNHANEPVHHVPFLFNRLGVPWMTQEWTRLICRRAYHNSVEGLVGNEDVGQMSAWFVLASSGIHPVCPGDNRWEITSPVFDKVVMELDPHFAKGRSFTIVAKNNSPENIYIQSATLNGRPYLKCWLPHSAIAAGGVLELEMGATPNKSWGVEDLPAAAAMATADTIVTHSDAMHKDIKAVVVKPAGYENGAAYPVVYLLHGYSGNYGDWIQKVPAIKEYADRYKVLIVCPDGNYGSWYFDSPVDTSWKYESYVGKELVSWVDAHYHTIPRREARAITGLSMGGHGALFLAIRHQDTFGAAGSMSGGVDMRPFPKNWEISRRLGSLDSFPQRWADYSVVNQTGLLKPGSLSIIFDCGSEDFFYGVNNQLHEKLLAEKIPHVYSSRPGGHDWNFWSTSVETQLLYFHHFFELAVKTAWDPRVDVRIDSVHNRQFTRSSGWNGGDGLFSVALPGQGIAWTTQDSFIGDIGEDRNRKGDKNTFVRNAVMLQKKDSFYTLNPVRNGKPGTFIRYEGADEQKEWYWTGESMTSKGKWEVLLNHFKKSGKGDWDYGIVSTDVAVYSLPDMTLEKVYKDRYVGDVIYSSILEDADGYTYIYGSKGKGFSWHTYAARVKGSDLSKPWEYYNGKGWSAAWTDAPVGQDITTPTVFKDGGAYFLVSQQVVFGADIYLYEAKSPAGPFINQRTLYHVPAEHSHPGLYTYNAVVHRALSDSEELLLSYNINPANFMDNFDKPGSADLYRPYFVRVKNWKKVYE